MTQIISQVFDRTYFSAHACERWRIVQLEDGRFRAEQWVDRDRMTDEERAEYEKDEEQWAAYEVQYPGTYPEQPIPTFPTEALAVEYTRLIDEQDGTDDDLHAFGAPSECYRDAHRSLERREQEFWAKVEAAEQQQEVK